MPKFTPKRFEEIFGQMISRVVARTDLSDVADSSVFKHVLAAAARSDDELYYQMGLLLALFSIDQATGDDLDERAKDIQPAAVSRNAAQKATGLVVFSRSGTVGTVSIPVGTVVKTASGQAFTTTSVGTISAASPEQISGHGVGRDSNTVNVIALVPGVGGNVGGGTIIKFNSKPSGIDEVVNPTKFVNGIDRELDDAFRQRLKDYINSLARCTVRAVGSNVIGKQDPVSGSTILFAKVWEDVTARGNIIVYVDDGTGAAETVARSSILLQAIYTWNGTTTVTTADTSEVAVDDWIRYGEFGELFQISVVTPGVSVTILNPGSDTILSGSSLGTYQSDDIITEGLDVGDVAFGGEVTLFTDNKPLKDSLAVVLASTVRGNLTKNTDYVLNPASGQIDFIPALVTGEQIASGYVHYTGIIAYAQKIIDGDANDRINFPGLRAAGVLARALVPTQLLTTVIATVTIAEGFAQADVKAAVRQAVKDYINTLNISGDVIRNQIIKAITLVPGVLDVELLSPADNVIILDDQLARTVDSIVTIN